MLRETERALLSFHDAQGLNEGVAYWAGRQSDESTIVTSVFVPKADAQPRSVDTSHRANGRFVNWLHEHSLIQVGHVHSHPPGIDRHSDGDDRWIYGKTPHLLSLVVTDYGLDGIRPIEDHGWHVCEGKTFRLLPREEVTERIHVFPNATDDRNWG